MYLMIYSQYIQGTNTSTVLTGSGCAVIDGYFPAEGGDDVTPVIDQFDIWLNGTEAQNRAKLAEIRMALESAKQFKNTQRRAFLYYDPYSDVGTDDVYRSRILSGRVIHNARMNHQLKRDRMRLTLIIERDPWWEDGDEAYIPLTNGNGTDYDDEGIRVYNCGDHATVDTSYKRDNWVTIDGVNDLDGDLPAPVHFVYGNIADLDIHARTIHAFNNINATPASFDGIIEAEEYGADTSLTGASASYVGAFTIADASETMFWYLDVDNQVKYGSTGYFTALLRFKYDQITNLSALKFKIELYETTQGSIYMSDYFYPSSVAGQPVYAISPVFKLQPSEEGSTNPDGYLLRLYAYQESGSSISLVMDDIHIYPAEQYRVIGSDDINLRIGFSYYVQIDDEQGAGLLYEGYQDGVDIRSFAIPEKRGQLMVQPGVNQKISWVFGMTTADTQTKINSAYFKVIAKYRPRRRTI